MTEPRISPLLANGQPTIGLFIEGVGSTFQTPVWNGFTKASQARGWNLAGFIGGALDSPQGLWDRQRNIVYEIARGLHLDGLVIMGSLGNFITREQYQAFIQNFAHIPTVAIATTGDPQLVSASVDNGAGMADLVGHCISIHRYRRFAFVCGPDGSPEARERFNAFRAVLASHGIPFSSDDCYSGDFTRQCGARAARAIAERGIPYDVIITANDDTALGLLQEFSDAGIRVPETVAVVGFDDIEESRYHTPPLTTVAQPIGALAEATLDLLGSLMRGETVEHDIRLPPQLIVRQSCGCARHAHARIHEAGGSRRNVTSAVDVSLDELVKVCLAHARRSGDAESEHDQVNLRTLVTALHRDITHPSGKHFIKAFDSVARDTIAAGIDVTRWIPVLTRIRGDAIKVAGAAQAGAVDTLTIDALILLSELAQRQEGHRRTVSAQGNQDLRTIGDVLQNALDLEHVLDIICTSVRSLSINSCYVSLCEPGEASRKKSRLILEYRDGRRDPSGCVGASFDACLLSPDGVAPLEGPSVCMVEPLYFHTEQYGFALFEVADCRIVDVLHVYMGGALHSSLLVKKVQEQSAALSRANSELTALREKEKAYLEAVHAELELGRKIQTTFLPARFPQPPGWEISGVFVPARVVSGDFYDAIELDDHTLALVIADISGKGVGAALFMSVIRTLIRSFAERFTAQGTDVLDAIVEANRYVIRHHSRREGRWMFATLFLGILDTATGTLTYTNAGHNPPIITGATGTMPVLLKPTGPAIGIQDDPKLSRASVVLNPGSMLFSYTDGATEAKNPDGAVFSTDRLKAILAGGLGSAREVVDAVFAAVQSHTGSAEQFDDVTMLAVKRL